MARPIAHGKAQRGFSYLVVLFIALMLGIASTATYEHLDTLSKREREQQWLFVGLQYKEAIKRYYQQSPEGIGQLPMKVEDLLKDSRYVAVHRYLRKAYADPITEQAWRLVLNDEQAIVGVVSASDAPVLQLANVQTQLKTEAQSGAPATYADFKFVLDKAELEGKKDKEDVDADEDVTSGDDETDGTENEGLGDEGADNQGSGDDEDEPPVAFNED